MCIRQSMMIVLCSRIHYIYIYIYSLISGHLATPSLISGRLITTGSARDTYYSYINSGGGRGGQVKCVPLAPTLSYIGIYKYNTEMYILLYIKKTPLELEGGGGRKGCEKKVMDPAVAARRSNDINQVCRTGTKGVRCASYISIYQPVK